MQHEGVGLTHDVSTKSAFVFTTTPPPVRATIKIKTYSPLRPGMAKSLRMHGEGRVVRVQPVEHIAARRGFAVATDRVIVHRVGMRGRAAASSFGVDGCLDAA